MRSFQITLIVLFQLLFLNQGLSQYCENDHSTSDKHVDTSVRNVKDYFLHGTIGGHLRNYFMSTINESANDDHYANGIGGSLFYATARWKGIHFGVKGIFTYNLFSSELAGDDDSIAPAKWEQELFDVMHPHKVDDLDRLEELYVAYDNKRVSAKIGKIDINEGPLLRRWDGRMKSFVYKGGWSKWTPRKGLNVYNGLITGVSPRGMTEWYSINEAIGLLNRGLLNDTLEMDYHEYSKSKGIMVNAFEWKRKRFQLEAWNYHFHHIYNTSWFQLEVPVAHWSLGGQYALQFSTPFQQRLETHHRYYIQEKASHTVSLQVKYNFNNDNSVRVAHTAVLGDAPFLFPKELGRDNLFTSVSRSRMDGLGKTNVSLIEAELNLGRKKHTSLITSLQYVNSPMCDDHILNKYHSPDYTQLNFRVRHNFIGVLEGMYLNLLYVLRYSSEKQLLNLTENYYKTNLHHFSLVLDVVF